MYRYVSVLSKERTRGCWYKYQLSVTVSVSVYVSVSVFVFVSVSVYARTHPHTHVGCWSEVAHLRSQSDAGDGKLSIIQP